MGPRRYRRRNRPGGRSGPPGWDRSLVRSGGWCHDSFKHVHVSRTGVAGGGRATTSPRGDRGRPCGCAAAGVSLRASRWRCGLDVDRGSSPVGAGPDRGGQACRLLGPVGCGGRPPCTPGLSTWWSSRSLHGRTDQWKPRLEEGFALRCLQRLSFPDLATRRCPERDSRHTRGRSSPILSY